MLRPPTGRVAWCAETKGYLWFSQGSPRPWLSHFSVPSARRVPVLGPRGSGQPVGLGNSKASKVRSLENLSGRDADPDGSVHLYLIHVPRTKFQRSNTLASRKANKIVLHFVLKANSKNRGQNGRTGTGWKGILAKDRKRFQDNALSLMPWKFRSRSWLLCKETSFLYGNHRLGTYPPS